VERSNTSQWHGCLAHAFSRGIDGGTMSSRKEVQQLIKQAECQGWVVESTKGGHYKWLSPFGGFFFSASTPSDPRAINNIKKDLTRYGYIEITKKGKK
jgi:hypothetical protein